MSGTASTDPASDGASTGLQTGAGAPRLVCEPMNAASLPGALAVLTEFLTADPHYRSSSAAYGDAGPDATRAALELFLAKPELGFVFVARAGEDVVAACVVCYAISTSSGGVVVKLDDVSVRKTQLGNGIGSAMLNALKDFLRSRGASRIDCGCHRDNYGGWRFYERHAFAPLHEERLACLLV